MTDKSVERVLVAYRLAALKFIDKVDTGQARSVETYNDLINAVLLHDKLDSTRAVVSNVSSQ